MNGNARQHPWLYTSATILTFLCLVYLIFSFYAIGNHPWALYNSDAIYTATLFQDIVTHGHSLKDWYLSPVTCFLPDQILFFFLAPIIGNLKVTLLVYVTIQIAFYFALILAIAKHVLPAHKPLTLFTLAIFLQMTLFAAGYLQQEAWPIMFGGHFGALLDLLLSLLLIITALKTNARWVYTLFFIVCAMSVFSDLVFIPQFCLSAFLTLCIMQHWADSATQARYYQLIYLTIFSTLLGYFCFKLSQFLLHAPAIDSILRRYYPSDIIQALQQIRTNLTLFYQRNAIILLGLFGFIAGAMSYLVKLGKTKQPAFLAKEEQYTALVIIFILMCIISSILSLIFLDNDLMPYNGMDTRFIQLFYQEKANFHKLYFGLRHCQAMLLLPIFLGLPLLLTCYSNLAELLQRYYLIILAAILSCAYVFTPRNDINNLINFYPPTMACLDHYATEYHLQNGYANYWQVKSLRFLSKTGINLATINLAKVSYDSSTYEIRYMPWMDSLTFHQHRTFNFIFFSDLDPLNPAQFTQQLHQLPSHRLLCPGPLGGQPYHLWIYDAPIAFD